MPGVLEENRPLLSRLRSPKLFRSVYSVGDQNKTIAMTVWRLSHRFDKEALPLANRHYNRQKPDSPQFVPPGRCVVLLSSCKRALWVSLWQKYVRHKWPNTWNNSLFRNEGAGVSSELILSALAITRGIWGDPPSEGVITFIDPEQVRHKRDPGRCYRKVGFRPDGWTGSGKLVLRLEASRVPLAESLPGGPDAEG